MKTVFADTFYFLALMSERDHSHDKAMAWTNAYRGRLVTTEWVLLEYADGISSSQSRSHFAQFRKDLLCVPTCRILPFDDGLYEEGIALYTARPDKKWSLTDCISFAAMNREGLLEALTGDHHFEQAGFIALL